MQYLSLQDAIFDGEVVILNKGGTANFQSLQNALKRGRGQSIDAVYFVFDLPHLSWHDLTAVPLLERKEL